MILQELFLCVLNMSITASYVILAVLLLRLVLKGMPKKYSYALWSVVGFRLICPVSFKSVFSLFSLKPFDMTKAQQMNEYSLTYVKPEKDLLRDELTTGVSAVNSVIEKQIVPSNTFQSSYSVIMLVLEALWVTGIAALLIYSTVKFIKLKKHLSTSILIENNIYKSVSISSPFIVGIIKPKIYLPSDTDEGYMQYVLAHERYHIKRFDNGVKLISYFLLVLHWFNPLVWLAFYLTTKDMEMSCDEAVISKYPDIKKSYSTALLSFATNKKFPAPSPISFSENGVKARIKNVLKYRKPKKILQAVAIILCLALLTACTANPKTTITETDITNAVSELNKVTDTINIESDVYTAGETVASNLAMSYFRENGRYYDKITIKKNSLSIIDNEGNNIFNSESAEEKPFRLTYDSGAAYIDEDSMLGFIDDGENLLQGNITCVTYKNSSMSKDGDVTYKVYFNGNEPVAFSDISWVYRLEPMDFEKLLSDTVIENEKNKYLKGDYFGEAHKILGIREGDLNGNDTEKYVTYYIYKEVAWLSAEEGNELGRRLVNTSGGASPAAIVFERKGNSYKPKEYSSLNDDYHSQNAKELLPEYAYNEFEQLRTENLSYLDKELYKQIVEKYLPDTGEYIAVAFEFWDNTDDTFEDKQTLINLGDYTVEYCYSKFLDGESNPALEYKYMLILQELLGNDARGISAKTGSEFFARLKARAENRLSEWTLEDMEKYYPYEYLLLTMSYDGDNNGSEITAEYAKLRAETHLKSDFENEFSDFVYNGEIQLRQPNEGDYLATLSPFGNAYYEVTFLNEKESYSVTYYVDSKTADILSSRETAIATDVPAQTLQADLAELEPVELSDDKIITASEVSAYGINGSMKEADVIKLLGKPNKTTEERDEIFGKKVYVYDSARVIFIKTMYGEPVENMEEVESAEFTDKNAELPRGIKIGDSLYDTLKKLPREFDYRTGVIYGDPYDKYSPGHAVIGYENEGLILKISCGYWPLIKIHFNSDLAIDSFTIVYNPNGIGT